jgi:imidazolonepropionase-like amidohydrolase
VVSMGTDQPLAFDIRAEQRGGRPHIARLFTAYRGFTSKDGYPTSAPGIKGLPYEVESRSDVKEAIDELASHEVDVVKVWVDDHMGQETKIAPELSKAIVQEARRAGLKPVAHVFYLQDAKDLVKAGLAGMVHAVRDQPVDDELIAAMKRQGAWQAASTLARELSMFAYVEKPAFLDDQFFARAIPSDVGPVLKSDAYKEKMKSDPLFARYPEFLETAQKNLKRLAEAGVPYGFGTDSGPPARIQGAFEHVEMELMVEAGLTPAQVITAATKSGAEFLGVSDDLGALEPGKWADVVVLSANPLENIRNTRSIEAVYVAGNRVER